MNPAALVRFASVKATAQKLLIGQSLIEKRGHKIYPPDLNPFDSRRLGAGTASHPHPGPTVSGPIHAVTERRDMRYMMPPVPGVQRQHFVQPQRP